MTFRAIFSRLAVTHATQSFPSWLLLVLAAFGGLPATGWEPWLLKPRLPKPVPRGTKKSSTL